MFECEAIDFVGQTIRIKFDPLHPDGTDKLTAVERQSLDEKIRIAVQTPPISAGDHSTRGLALLSLQFELP